MPAIVPVIATAWALSISLYFAARLARLRPSRQYQAMLFGVIVGVAATAILTFPPQTAARLVFAQMILAAGLIALIDSRWLIIPDALILALGLAGGAWLALTTRLLPQTIAMGAAFGLVVMGATYLYFHKVRGVAGLGFGDVKLMGVIGGIVGPNGVPIVIVVASLATLVAVAVLALFARWRDLDMATRRGQRSAQVPFAPGLVIAMIAYLVVL